MRKIQRRAVYVGTIVAMVAMAGGFAVATIPNAFTFNGGGQNGGAVTTGNTQYAGAVQINLADVNPRILRRLGKRPNGHRDGLARDL